VKTIKVKTRDDVPQNYTGIVVYPTGTKEWYLNGELHREEGPCTACKDCQSGNFEPASGDPEVSPKEKSLAKPKTCSKPGPASVYPNGTKHWFLNNKLHREDGPAIVWPNGEKQWWLNGELHREDGPAIVYPGGGKHWWLNGKEVDKQAVELFYMLKYNKLIKL
jgi:hypothetical protein